jgi:hypothetical protein
MNLKFFIALLCIYSLLGCSSFVEHPQKEESRAITLSAKEEVFVTIRKESDRSSLFHETMKKDEEKEVGFDGPVIIYTTSAENLRIYRDGAVTILSPPGVAEIILK